MVGLAAATGTTVGAAAAERCGAAGVAANSDRCWRGCAAGCSAYGIGVCGRECVDSTGAIDIAIAIDIDIDIDIDSIRACIRTHAGHVGSCGSLHAHVCSADTGHHCCSGSAAQRIGSCCETSQ